jgi:hypothetical protein
MTEAELDFLTVLKTPFRPRKGFESLSGRLNWVWVPCLVFLLLALMARLTVETPRQIAFQAEAAKAQNEKLQAEMQAQGGVTIDGQPAPAEGDGGAASGSDIAPTDAGAPPVDGEVIVPTEAGLEGGARTIVWVSNYVFGTLGLVAGLLFTALLFFVAGKVSAATAAFRAYLSMTALAFVPFGLRDLVQTAYMTLADTYIRHPGLSSFAAPKEPLVPGGIVYGLLAFADVWTLWAVALLFAGLRHGIGLDRKRALIAWGVFIGVALVSRIAVGGVMQTLSGGF